MKMVHYLALLC